MNKHNSIYLLHINKTGGHYMQNNILNPISHILANNNYSHLSGHLCWQPVKDNTYIITSLRDPVKRTVSQFCHFIKHINTNKSVYETVDNLMAWVEKNKNGLSNFQSKSLLFTNVEAETNLNLYNDEKFANFKVDDNQLWKNINRINIILNDKILNTKTANYVKDKIIRDLAIDCNRDYLNKEVIFNIERKNNENDKSLILYKKLGTIEKQYIEEINRIDLLIYHSNIYTKIK